MPIVFFTLLTIYLFWRGIHLQKNKSLLLGFFILGILISLKLTNLLLAFLILFWYLLINIKKIRLDKQNETFMLPFKKIFFLGGFVTFLTYILSQPSFFLNTIGLKQYLLDTLKYWFGTKTVEAFYFGQTYLATEVSRSYPLVSFFIVTPLTLLLFFLIGLVYSLKKIKDATFLLLLLWFSIPLAKFLLPGAPNYQLTRLFMEILPAFAIITSAGIFFAYTFLWKKLNKKKLFTLAFAITLVLMYSFIIFSSVKIHPYEESYFNVFIGSLGEAQRSFDVDYSANSVASGIRLVNEKAEPGATIIMPIAGKLGAYYIREDLTFVPGKNSFGEYDKTEDLFTNYDTPFYVVYPVQENILYHLLNDYDNDTLVYYLETYEKPDYTITKDGATLFKLYYVTETP